MNKNEKALQANNEMIEAALKSAAQVNFITAPNTVSNKPLSTDPLPPIYHTKLADDIISITDYMVEEVKRHKELMMHIESLTKKLNSMNTNMKNFHKEETIEAPKFFIKEKRNFWNFFGTKSQRIEVVLAIFVVVSTVYSVYKFL